MTSLPVKTKKTYFGLAAMILGITADLFLAANFGVSYLRISIDTFNLFNNLTALFYCIFIPLTLALGMIGYLLKNDSKTYSRIAVILAALPFFILFAQFINALRK
jgi:hypothetical protein